MRIVSVLSSATEILFAIGAGNQVVAISHECDYPPEATSLPRATRSLIDPSQPSASIDAEVKRLSGAGAALYEIDQALLRDLAPDLIITQAQCDVCAVRYQDVIDFVASEPVLRNTKVLALNPTSIGDIFADVLRVGEAIGRPEAAVRLKENLVTRATKVTIRAWPKDQAQRPRVAAIEWTEPLMAAGNWTPELIEMAGGISPLARSGEPSSYTTWLDVTACQPEMLIVAPCGFDLQRSLVEARRLTVLPGYDRLPAIVNGCAFVIDGSAYLNRSGPRIVDSLEILAHLIRPDSFGPPTGDLAEGRAWARLLMHA